MPLTADTHLLMLVKSYAWLENVITTHYFIIVLLEKQIQ